MRERGRREFGLAFAVAFAVAGGQAARGSPVGTDNEKGKLFRFLPLIPLLALGARLPVRDHRLEHRRECTKRGKWTV